MIEFKSPSISDAKAVRDIIDRSEVCSCDMNFANMFAWSEAYGVRICLHNGLLLKGYFKDNERTAYVNLPVGEGNKHAAIKDMFEYADSIGYTLEFSDLTDRTIAEFESIFPGKYTFKPDRDFSDYIYYTADLAKLSGKKYQKKRNHISQFDRKFEDHRFEPINAKNIADAKLVCDRWNDENPEKASEDEIRALKITFDNFDVLEMSGGILYANQIPCAMTMGSRVTGKVFDVQFEKALAEFDGAYTKINQFFAKTLTNYKYINREEDVGVEGLRKAKLSYHPAFINLRHIAVKIEE